MTSCRDGADAQYMQKPYNFTTNTLKAYLSTQAPPLSAFVISKVDVSGQRSCRRQLNAKVCGHESAFCLQFFNNDIANGLSTYHHFSMKMMLITVWSSMTTQRLLSFKFTLVNKSHSQHPVVAVRCTSG